VSATSTVRVPLPGTAAYDVLVGPDLLSVAGERVREVTASARIALVSDSNVSALFGREVRDSLEAAGFEVHDVVIEPGEASKSWSVAGDLLEALAAAGLDRRDAVVALGGGVVGDLAGFVSATYMRGIDFVQLPTTLLAQVDSSVGGKTGVDLAAGKNLAGAFKQPLLVLADTDALTRLPLAEWQSGLAEIAKGAVLGGERFLRWLEANARQLAAPSDAAAVHDAVREAVTFKARVVAADEKERELRECLNYGHTLGHAIENVAGYGAVPHGVAVAEGIRFAARLAVDAVGASAALAKRQGGVLDALGIPRVAGDFDVARLRRAMSSDKKARGGVPRFVVLTGPGTWQAVAVDEELLERHLLAFVSEARRRQER
jgi:3-dehydroquinate synthase